MTQSTLHALQLKTQVVKQVGKKFLIKTEKGELLTLFARKKATKAVCGDWVETEELTDQPIITKILKRDNLLSRTGFRKQVKPIAANLSQLCIVTATYPGFNSELIDRYIVAGIKLGLSICLIFNKQDLLADNTEQAELANKLYAIYQKLNIHIVNSSTHDSDSINQLKQLLKKHTSIFAGESGVGKSSLIQEIIPELNLKVGELSKNVQLGKHTTTHTEIFYLKDGGKIIDSPGVRSFDVSHFEKQDIQYGFEEFRELSKGCKYNNCSHINEPEKLCQVKLAVKDKRIASERYKNYKTIYEFEDGYSD